MMMGESTNKMMMMMNKKKRKELEDDFSDFSLSSPATKICRLDAELAPIMEEDEVMVPPVFEQQPVILPPAQVGAGGCGSSSSSVIIEEFPLQQNEERAIVVFNPINTPHSGPSLSVSSHILAALKKKGPWSNQSSILQNSENKLEEGDEILQGSSNECLAVVPWVQSQIPLPSQKTSVEQPDTSEMMEGEDMDTAIMDIEDNYTAIEQTPANEYVGAGSGEGIQQQHYMVPPQNASQQIVWFQ